MTVRADGARLHCPRFKTSPEIRCFLAQAALQARTERIGNRVYCLETNYIQLLRETTRGELSLTMIRIQNVSVRQFSGRGGDLADPLRAALGLPILILAYWAAVHTYMDVNPVSPWIVATERHCPAGSVHH